MSFTHPTTYRDLLVRPASDKCDASDESTKRPASELHASVDLEDLLVRKATHPTATRGLLVSLDASDDVDRPASERRCIRRPKEAC